MHCNTSDPFWRLLLPSCPTCRAHVMATTVCSVRIPKNGSVVSCVTECNTCGVRWTVSPQLAGNPAFSCLLSVVVEEHQSMLAAPCTNMLIYFNRSFVLMMNLQMEEFNRGVGMAVIIFANGELFIFCLTKLSDRRQIYIFFCPHPQLLYQVVMKQTYVLHFQYTTLNFCLFIFSISIVKYFLIYY